VVLVESREIVRAEDVTQLEQVAGALESAVDASGDEDAVGSLEVLVVQIVDVIDPASECRLESGNVRIL